ncbi:PREDICTED: BAG family molecular chaperone regulator 2-like [Nicotiana attenuata]|uniref:Bag family molecular chaperone regulator 2 n=1 Tax=Nicotiana attenuata TaxID=49451 RepID=A0A1J6IZI7_NICAT|nr:PREDICTED: BAG family molecular chaperone regulator 2-like [Nicotiana attenuata]OIT05944.1 bag family molecular chaperone regulator 2 [Nicotiana attenuata]
MIKLRCKKFFRSNSKNGSTGAAAATAAAGGDTKIAGGEIKWELRPGGMLVQKRECAEKAGDSIITLRVSTVSKWHDISIQATSTFGELKMILAMVTGLEPKEQRLLYRGKEREDYEYLHMVGVKDKDKVLLFEDPAIKERKKLLNLAANDRVQVIGSSYHTICV